MIIQCPLCLARYVAPIGLFAQGGRAVRCARCRHQWRAELPNSIDVYEASPLPPLSPPPPPFTPPPLGGPPEMGESLQPKHEPPPNLPALPNKWRRYLRFRIHWRRGLAVAKTAMPVLKKGGLALKKAWRLIAFLGVGVVILALPVVERQEIVRAMPVLRDVYEGVGLHIDHSTNGLSFQQVKSELRYDSGTMRLVVDGVIHNATEQTQFVPDIKARALGPDQRIIQSWWVEAPAATVAGNSDVPFHTEASTPMKRTIEDVYLEFYNQDEKGDVAQ